jgi:hypothetical protein
MKKYLALLVLLQTCIYAQAQIADTYSALADSNAKKYILDPNKPPQLTRKQFEDELKIVFNSVVTGSSKAQVGNFAAIDITQPTATFNYSFLSKGTTLFTVNGSADVKNGLSPVFNNSILNTDVSFQPKISFLIPGTPSLTNNEKDIKAIQTSQYNLLYTLKENLYIGENRLRLSLVNQKKLKLLISDLSNDIVANPGDAQKYKTRLWVAQDSLNSMIQHMRNTYQIDISVYQDDTPDFENEIKEYETKLSKSFVSQLTALSEPIAPVGFNLKWISISYKITNSAFILYDPVLSYKAQVNKTNFITHSITLEYDYYKYNKLPNQSLYFSIGADPFIGDNLSSLTSQTMTDTHDYSATPDTRSSVKTYTAYLDSGKYKRNLKGVKLHADFYYFLAKGNQFAIHLNPMATYSQGSLPEYDEGVGLICSFLDPKDTTGKAIVRTEFYCNFLDVTNSLKSKNNLASRNTIGLRFTFPINFVNP